MTAICSLILLLIIFSSSYGNQHRKHPHLSSKARLSGIALNDYEYGMHLPALAIDFSELILSAYIEVTDNEQLYLIISLMPHQLMMSRKKSFLKAIETDQDQLLLWLKTVKLWSNNALSGNKTTIINREKSKLWCILKNNDGIHNNSYVSSTQWFDIDNKVLQLDNEFDKSVKLLRCRIKGTKEIYNHHIFSSNRHLFVDLIRAENDLDAKYSHDKLVISFSVPWRKRSIGYPSRKSEDSESNVFATSDILLPRRNFQYFSHRNHSIRHSRVSSQRDGSKSIHLDDYKYNESASRMFSCIAGIRPRNPSNNELSFVTPASLVEAIETLLAQGVSHIFLGFQLHWESFHMKKYLSILQRYLDSQQISIWSMSIPDYDDVAGIAHLAFTDEYANLLFYNHCLMLSKGIADYLLVLEAREFVDFRKMDLQTLSSESKASYYRQLFKSMRGNHSLEVFGSFQRSGPHNGKKEQKMIINPFQFSKGNRECVASVNRKYDLHSADKMKYLFPPNEYEWMKDYYKAFIVRKSDGISRHPMLLLTRNALAVRVDSREAFVVVCDNSHSQNTHEDLSEDVVEEAVVYSLQLSDFTDKPTPETTINVTALFQRTHESVIARGFYDRDSRLLDLARRAVKRSSVKLVSKDRKNIIPPYWIHRSDNCSLAAHIQDVFKS